MKKYLFPAMVGMAVTSLLMVACSKNNDTEPSVDVAQLKKDILNDVSVKVCKESYEDMFAKTDQFLVKANELTTATTEANLTACRGLWKDIRQTWEQTEAWLFGPISSAEIDPRIDTWPVDFNALDSILATSHTLDEAYVDDLEESLKGFHPIEYLLWGKNGTKTAAQFTTREKEYLIGLATNLKKLAQEVRDSWSGGYAQQLATGGSGSTEYPTLKAAYVEIADAMAGICDEVANGKIKDPFELQDPTQEESPFAKNSITDFTNNITGVMDMYQGKFINDGKGIEDLVRFYNLSLDTEIKQAHAAAIASLNAITDPFGDAITTQPTQVQNAMAKINALKTVLQDKLGPFIQQYAQ